MAKAYLLCGKICSGKTTFAAELKERTHAVLLSCDEITWQLFHNELGEQHDRMTASIQKYLLEKSVEIIQAGADVILDWGFWTAAERRTVREFFARQGIPAEWYYMAVTPQVWEKNIAKRNAAVLAEKSHDYFVDEGLRQKLGRLFEEPGREEMDHWIELPSE